MDGGQASQLMKDLLSVMIQKKASDVFITAGFPPALKIDNKIVPQNNQPFTSLHTLELARSIMNDKQSAEFEATKECNFAISPEGIGRFRVSIFIQQGAVGMVMRHVTSQIPSLEELGLPVEVMQEIAMTKRGMVLFVGATSMGKSTSLASMLDYRNANSHGHIITLEDPIEFVHSHRSCIITQREIGIDTDSWEVGLKNTLRQAPDIILMGEIRDRTTMEYAIAFAETGHLCLATLHANNSNQAIERVINFFPDTAREQALKDLSLNLKAVVSQRLLPRLNSKGRIPAIEIMLNSPLIADLIEKGEISSLKELMTRSTELGMQTFDQSLFKLYSDGMISYEDALKNADSVNDLRLRIKLAASAQHEGITPGSFFNTDNLDIMR